eukprot:228322-Rhodomonas_salina.1
MPVPASCTDTGGVREGEAEEGKQTLSTAATVQLLRYLVAFCWALSAAGTEDWACQYQLLELSAGYGCAGPSVWN